MWLGEGGEDVVYNRNEKASKRRPRSGTVDYSVKTKLVYIYLFIFSLFACNARAPACTLARCPFEPPVGYVPHGYGDVD